ncbi:MAG: hypothetical protein ACOYEV_17185 [Candidatus Nanopelagicales bacterium]|jgi:hypothetical protein
MAGAEGAATRVAGAVTAGTKVRGAAAFDVAAVTVTGLLDGPTRVRRRGPTLVAVGLAAAATAPPRRAGGDALVADTDTLVLVGEGAPDTEIECAGD